MDPDATLDLALECAREVRRAFGANDAIGVWEGADGLVTAFTALDDWIARGGFLPRRWEDTRRNDVT